MKKRVKNTIINILIIAAIISLALVIINKPLQNTDKQTSKCIASQSTLYIQLGCHACRTQEEMFGESYQYLNVVDCYYESEKCSEIQYTPTWIINNEFYIGVQSIDKLKELTGC